MSNQIYINPFNRSALQQAIIDDITNGEADFNCAVTLTFPERFVKTRQEAQQRCSIFRNKYNKAFGYSVNHRRYAKHDKKLSAPFAAIIEGNGNDVHLHYHLALHRPEHISVERFAQIVSLLWTETLDGNEGRNTVEDMYSAGWAGYITKEFSTGNTDAIDEKNYNVY